MFVDEFETEAGDAALQVYLLGSLDFDAALLLQRRLHYDVSGDRSQAALILCEHSPIITVGRQGSRTHLRFDVEDYAHRGLPSRWVTRGGGCWLHLPGQLAVYPILPLDRMRLTIPEYLQRFADVFVRTLDDFSVRSAVHVGEGGVWVGQRPIAALGIAVRSQVTMHGACFNVNPDLVPFRRVRSMPNSEEPMSSLERERRGPIRPALVRERLIEHFQTVFGFRESVAFSEHPLIREHTRRLVTAS